MRARRLETNEELQSRLLTGDDLPDPRSEHLPGDPALARRTMPPGWSFVEREERSREVEPALPPLPRELVADSGQRELLEERIARDTARERSLERPRRLERISPIERVGRTLALLPIFVIAALLWKTGASFTILVLSKIELFGLGAGVTTLGEHPLSLFGLSFNRQYLIPISMTLVEIFFWPRRRDWWKDLAFFFWPTEGQKLWKHLFFLCVLLVDIGTTVVGGMLSAAGGTLSLTAFQQTATLTLLVGGLLGLLCAVGPERLVKLAFRDAWELWVPRRSSLNRYALRWGLLSGPRG